MPERDLILSIDNGTQSLKALVFDPSGKMLAKERVAFAPYFSKHPGWAEQDPDVFWQALIKACRALWEKDAVDKERLAGVTLTTQRATVINLDKDGRPLRPAMLWLDQRKTYGLPFPGGLWGLAFRLLRQRYVIEHFQREAESNWIRFNQPEIWERTHKFLLLSGYLTWKLTGRFVDSIGNQVGYLPFDFKRLKWASSWEWRWKELGIPREMLPDLVAPCEPLGEITTEAALATGIPMGLPLIAAGSDKTCEVIGSGSLELNTGCLSYGTTATINVTSEKYRQPMPLVPPFPSAVPNWYTLEFMIYRGYWMVSWFKEEFAHREVQLADIQGIEAEELLDELVAEVPPGAMGLMLQPYWTPGPKNPGPEAKGAIIGFGDVHTRAHMYRSILEGLAYALRDGKERIEKRTGTPITDIRVSGGGSQSRAAMQATADIFGLPTSRPELYETSALGAAINAAAGLKMHSDFKAAVENMTRIGETFEPDPETNAMYDQLYRDVYRKMYKRLKPLYEKIKTITGYPK